MLRIALLMLFRDRAKYVMLVVGLTSIFGYKVLKIEQPPFFMPWQVPVFVAVIIILICCFSAAIGLRKIAKLEPAVVFK